MSIGSFGEDRRVRFQARYAAALEGFISKEEKRYYLNGIYVHPHPEGKGVLLVATDGHKLAVIRDEDGEANGGWICEFPKRAMAACKSKSRDKTLSPFDDAGDVHFVGRACYVTARGFDAPPSPRSDPTVIGQFHLASEIAPPIDGTFPNYEKVVADSLPKEGKKTAPAVTFNGHILAAFTKASSLLNEAQAKTQATMTIVLGEDNAQPSVVRIDGVPEFLGIVMPMRGNPNCFAMPDWLPRPKVDEAVSK